MWQKNNMFSKYIDNVDGYLKVINMFTYLDFCTYSTFCCDDDCINMLTSGGQEYMLIHCPVLQSGVVHWPFGGGVGGRVEGGGGGGGGGVGVAFCSGQQTYN